MSLFDKQKETKKKTRKRKEPLPETEDTLEPKFKKPAEIKKPKPQPKEKIFEPPPDVIPHMSELIGEKTAKIKFHCSYCGKTTIVQVSKDFNSVMCPFCNEETHVGPK